MHYKFTYLYMYQKEAELYINSQLFYWYYTGMYMRNPD